jgi:phage-related protein
MINGGFVLGGVPAKELGIIMISSSRRPILPSTVDRTMAIPGRHGAWDFGADLGPRQFELDCALIEQDAVSLQLAVERVAALLLDKHGRPRQLTLTLDIRPERSYMVRYVGSLDIERIIGLGRFTLPLVAYDPYSYADLDEYNETLQYDTGLEYDTGLLYPNPTGFTWLYAEQHSSLHNHSPLVTPLIVTIAGSVSGIKITNRTNSQSMTLTTVLSGQTLVIDGAKATITRNGQNAMSGLVAGDFVMLEPGPNQLVFEGTSPNAVVTFGWKHKFL